MSSDPTPSLPDPNELDDDQLDAVAGGANVDRNRQDVWTPSGEVWTPPAGASSRRPGLSDSSLL